MSRYEVKSQLDVEIVDDPARQHAILAELESNIMQNRDAWSAAGELSWLGRGSAVPIMVRCLDAPSEDAVRECLAGLGRAGGDDAIDALRTFVRSSRWGSLRDNARAHLRRLESAP